MTATEATQAITNALDALATELEVGRSEAMTRYLSALSRFHRYSPGNVALVLIQRPGATRIAGFNTWKRLDRHVRKGERALWILAPCISKQRKAEEAGEAEDTAAIVRRFRTVAVFDISQTGGAPLPEPSCVTGDAGNVLRKLEGFAVEQGIRLDYVSHIGGALGASYSGRVEVLESLDTARRFSTLAHELAHELLSHHVLPHEERKDKRRVETEAEAVAYVLCTAVGLDTNRASSDYISLYNGDKEQLRKSLSDIHRVAAMMLPAVIPGEQIFAP